ncbi:MAG: ABC transporter permease [Methanotrichaceae archaeon]|jgi:NitT/TauT family transport system permease protein
MNKRTVLKLMMPLAIIALWETLSLSIHNQFILPDIQSVLMVLLSPGTDIMGSGSLIENALMSLQRVCLGFLVATCLAVPLGVSMGRWEPLREALDGIVSALRPVPPLAWVPLALAWLKIGLASIVFIIALGAFFLVLLNTIQGVRGVKKNWIEAISMMGAKEHDLMVRVILPAAAPEIWTGMRIGFGIAWMCLVAAEMLPGTSTGLGYLIMYAYSWGQIQVVMAGMIAIGIIGIGIDRFFVTVERRWLSWRGL